MWIIWYNWLAIFAQVWQKRTFSFLLKSFLWGYNLLLSLFPYCFNFHCNHLKLFIMFTNKNRLKAHMDVKNRAMFLLFNGFICLKTFNLDVSFLTKMAPTWSSKLFCKCATSVTPFSGTGKFFFSQSSGSFVSNIITESAMWDYSYRAQ